MRPRETISMCLAVLGLAAGTVQAVPLTYIFDGTIQSKTDPADLLPDVAIEDKVKYTVMLDSETPRLPSHPNFGLYQADSAVLRIKETDYIVNPPVIEVFLTSGYGFLDVEILSASGFVGYGGAGHVALVDEQGTAIPGHALPLTSFDLAPFEHRTFSLTVSGPIVPPGPYPSEAIISGSLESFVVIPEPTTVGSMAVLGILIACNRRRRAPR